MAGAGWQLMPLLILLLITPLSRGGPLLLQQHRQRQQQQQRRVSVSNHSSTLHSLPQDDNEITFLQLNSTYTREEVAVLRESNHTHMLPPLSEDENDVSMLERRMNESRMVTWRLRGGRRLHVPPLVDKALRLMNLQQVVQEVETSVMSRVSCTACRAGASFLQHMIRTGKTKDDVTHLTKQFCISFKLSSPRVCDGITELFGGEVTYVLQRLKLSPEEICGFVIGDACGDIYTPHHEWQLTFPPVPKPPVIPMKPPKPGSPTFKVLHLSDTHYDPYYHEGANADCAEPLCCRLTNGPPASAATAAGRWGDYRKCDTPKRTVDSMLQHIAATHPDIDYILWTGDLPPHDVWNQTREENLDIIKQTVDQLGQTFPNIPIFPALGNHEGVPVNSFPPPFVHSDYSISWLYEAMDKQWRHWLPATTSPTVRRGAFYSVLVRPGFRIISLNMNYCNNKNWWLLLNSTDPGRELQWLIYELQSAELAHEKVHLIGHIPPGHSDCLKVWSRNYYNIINRYESTITAQFFGHTHFDEFELFYDATDKGRVSSVAYIGPSVTPYYDLNPGYRIYYIDADHPQTTRAVLDHETWVMNLKEANLYDYPIWYKLYSARAAYKMSSLMPQEWDSLLEKFTEDANGDFFDLYYKYYWKNSPVRPQCDADCKKRMLCDLRSGRSHDRKALCQEIESRIDAATSPGGWKAWIYNGLAFSYVNLMTGFTWLGSTISAAFSG
ncbi:hypothetical protein B566_EDAN004563 [Ephemera danica]|nr:hypothetical protein B566_EDAN004563 [Ephemera danica]